MFSAAPVARWFRGMLTFDAEGRASVALPARDEFLQAMDVVHGAVITFAADSAAWFTAALATGQHCLTSDFNIRLLSAVGGDEGLRATGEVVKSGRTLVVVRSRVVTLPGDRLVAEGLWSHVVLRP